jgi:hypothetical protein
MKLIWFVVLLLAACAGWIVQITMVQHAQGADSEGVLYIAGLAGVLAFIAPGPLYLASLKETSDAKNNFREFALVLLVLMLPAAAFEVLILPSSMLSSLVPGGPWHLSQGAYLRTMNALAAICWYLVTATLGYFLLRAGRTATRLGSGVWILVCLGVVAIRMFR